MLPKGKIAALILAEKKGKGAPAPASDEAAEEKTGPEETAEDTGASEEAAVAGEELAAALQSGDGAEIASAFRALMGLCR